MSQENCDTDWEFDCTEVKTHWSSNRSHFYEKMSKVDNEETTDQHDQWGQNRKSFHWNKCEENFDRKNIWSQQ